MNNLRKVGLTALAASLATVSAHATELSVAGSASIYSSSQEDATSTGFYQNDKIACIKNDWHQRQNHQCTCSIGSYQRNCRDTSTLEGR